MRKTLLILGICFAQMPLMAQTESGRSSGAAPQRFREYRERMLGNYQDYRSRVLDNYDKFLEGVWTEFAAFKGEEYNPKPKPAQVPELPAKTLPAPPAELPAPAPGQVTDIPVPAEIPQPADREGAGQPSESQPAQAAPRSRPIPVDFYGITVSLPAMETRLMHAMRDKTDYARQWRSLAEADFAPGLIASLRNIAGELKLNDYLTFDLLMKYAAAAHPEVDASSRASLVHFLLANMGYGARLGATDSGVTLLLLPLKQKIYARSFMEIEGRRYYVFTDDSHTPADIGGYVNTCRLPSGADMGRELDLRIPDGLNFPYKPCKFDISYGGMNLKGELNANLMPVLYNYPQMPMGDYAASCLMPELRESLVEQVRSQLGSMPKLDAVNTLLGFIQSGFAYATDEEQHGFEKPYFLEETLFYPKCDCEDRSIMYGYLLSKALDVENHLIFYPGHESVALTLDSDQGAQAEGDNYTYKGKRFLISDPTFLGASTGVCMPQYKTVTPKIDYIYTR